jgi:hypothetical protein
MAGTRAHLQEIQSKTINTYFVVTQISEPAFVNINIIICLCNVNSAVPITVATRSKT